MILVSNIKKTLYINIYDIIIYTECEERSALTSYKKNKINTFTAFCPERHAYIHSWHIGSSLGFNILPKDTFTCRPGESNQQPSDNKALALPPSPNRRWNELSLASPVYRFIHSLTHIHTLMALLIGVAGIWATSLFSLMWPSDD